MSGVLNKMSGNFDGDRFKSDGNERGTPNDFFNPLNEEFHFTLDPCASDKNHKCKKYYTKLDDGLKQDWSSEVVWINPPYGNALKNWIKKSYEESQKGATVVILTPARTNTNWWHDYCMKAKEIRLIRGRIKFLDETGITYPHGLPYPLALVVFQKGGVNPIFSSYDTPKQKENNLKDGGR